MPWHNDKQIDMTFCSRDAQNAWALINGVGWKRIKTGATDGVTNVFVALNAAKANARPVSVFENDTDHLLEQAYLK